MNFENKLDELFPGSYAEPEFVEKTYNALTGFGFTSNNSIACVGVCRDEITQPFVENIKNKWGEAFNFSSLAGMLFLGKTGFSAAEHHAPNEDGKERYIYYALSHIAIDKDGQVGLCERSGRKGLSAACGALQGFQIEMAAGNKLQLGLDFDDIEMSLIRMRLIKEIHYGWIPDLLELTKLTLRIIQDDLKRMIELTVDKKRSDYAVFTGIQIHGPGANFIWPESSYLVVDGLHREIKLS